MASVNVLKQKVKTRKRPTKKPKIKSTGKQKTIKFDHKSPWATFVNTEIEDMKDVIQAYIETFQKNGKTIVFDNDKFYDESSKYFKQNLIYYYSDDYGKVIVSRDRIHPSIINKDVNKLNQVKTLYKLINTLPASILHDFFNYFIDQPAMTIYDAYHVYIKRPKVKNIMNRMKEFIKIRTAQPLNLPPLSTKKHESEHSYEFYSMIQYPSKYDLPYLNKLSLASLIKLAKTEKIKNPSKKTKQQLIDQLYDIKVARGQVTNETPVRYGNEFPNPCESEYFRALWIKNHNIRGMVVNPKAYPEYQKYATNIKISLLYTDNSDRFKLFDYPKWFDQQEWFTVKSTWYKFACSGDRTFIPNAVGYVVKDYKHSKSAVLIESQEIFQASVDYKPLDFKMENEPQDIRNVSPSFKSIVQPPITSQIQNPPINQSNLNYIEKEQELAPGLFAHLRLLISGTSLSCNQCNVSVVNPRYKSIKNRKIVIFCSNKCLNEYDFSKIPDPISDDDSD